MTRGALFGWPLELLGARWASVRTVGTFETTDAIVALRGGDTEDVGVATPRTCSGKLDTGPTTKADPVHRNRTVFGWELRAVDLTIGEWRVDAGTRVRLRSIGFAGSGWGRTRGSCNLGCDGGRAPTGFKGTIRSPLQSAVGDSLFAFSLRDRLIIEPTFDHGDGMIFDTIPLRKISLLMRMEVVVSVAMKLSCHKRGRDEAKQKSGLHPHQEGTRKYREIESSLLEGRLMR